MNVLTKAPESQFAYVVLAARRARQIMAGAPPLVENPRTLKATRIACEELENGMIEYDFTEPASIDEDKDGSFRGEASLSHSQCVLCSCSGRFLKRAFSVGAM